MQISLFQHLRHHFGERISLIDCTKLTLVQLSHVLEDVVLSRQIPALLFTGFQESSHWRAETERYRELSLVAEQVCIFAGNQPPEGSSETSIHVTLEGEDPLRQEWFVCILSEEFSVVLCGQDRHAPSGDEAHRRFATFWTFDPKIVSEVFDLLLSVVDVYRPDRAAELRQARSHYPPRPANPEILEHVNRRMLAFEQQLFLVAQREVEERQRAQEKLSQQETLLTLASHLARLGGWAIDLETGQVTWSDEISAIYETPPGYLPSVEEAIGFYAPEWQPVIREKLSDCAENGIAYDMELELITATGKRLWTRAIGQPERNEQGSIVRVRGALQDISEKKEAEERIRRLAQRLTNTLESITDAVFTLDHDWRFAYVNQQAEKLLQRNREELLGHSIWDEFSEAVGSTFYEQYHRAMTRNRTVEFEEFYPPLDTWFSVRAFPSTDGLTVYFRDVTEERQARRALQSSEERFRLVARATNDAIWDWNLRTDELWWNEGVETLFGYRRDQIAPDITSWTEHIHPEDCHWVVESIYDTLRGDAVKWEKEYRFLRSDGQTAYVLDKAFVIRNEQGIAIRAMGGMTDLTERKRLETQFLRAQRLESIGTLAGGIAHDLNNVLAPILLTIPILKRAVQGEKDLQRLELIEDSVRRGADLIRQVLTFARGADGQRVRVDVGQVIRDVANLLRETLHKNIRMEASVAPGLWPMRGDPTQIHQVLVNLCINARDAMPTGGEITVTARNLQLDPQHAHLVPQIRPGKYILVTVVDSGVGIPKEIQERIFDPFFTTKATGEGTGLGLSTVQGILKGHGGFITLYSEKGQGTVFKIYLPAEGNGTDAGASDDLDSLPRGNGEVVLLVDDEASVRLATEQTLAEFGYRVITARDGAEALSIYADQAAQIDVVLTDIVMPRMDGLRTIQALRNLDPSVKVIAASGLSTTDTVTKASAAGATEFLSKPFAAHTLLSTLHRVLHPDQNHP